MHFAGRAAQHGSKRGRALTKMSRAEWGVGSSLSIWGTRLQNIQLEPAAVEMTSKSSRVSRPALAPSAIASAAAAMCTPWAHHKGESIAMLCEYSKGRIADETPPMWYCAARGPNSMEVGIA